MKKQIRFAVAALLFALPSVQAAKLNFIVIFRDDLGCVAIEPFGSTKHTKPMLNKMAKEVMKLTQLKILWIKGNPDLTKAQIDELQKALPKCEIFSNSTKYPPNAPPV